LRRYFYISDLENVCTGRSDYVDSRGRLLVTNTITSQGLVKMFLY